MSAMTAVEVRRVRARIVAPGLTDTERRFHAWECLDATRKAPFLALWWADVLDLFDPDWTREDEQLCRRVLADVVDREVS